MGGSYGGYATLVGLTFTPDCSPAASISSARRTCDAAKTVPPYWSPFMPVMKVRVGD